MKTPANPLPDKPRRLAPRRLAFLVAALLASPLAMATCPTDAVSEQATACTGDIHGHLNTSEISDADQHPIENKVLSIKDGANITSGSVYGIKSTDKARLRNNHVFVTNANIGGNLYGAYTVNEFVIDNSVTVDCALIGCTIGEVYGAIVAADQGYAEGNKVKITGNGTSDTTLSAVYGGHSTQGVSGNSVEIKDAHVNNSVYGGHAGDAYANENHVTLDNVLVGGDVIAGKTVGSTAVENEILLKNGTVVTGGVTGGRGESVIGSTNTSRNEVHMKSRSSADFVIGGDSAGYAHGNMVFIDNATVTDYVMGARTTSSIAGEHVTLSEVHITNHAEIGGNVYGGYVKGNHATARNANGSTITLDSSVRLTTGDVYGGYIEEGDGTANGNFVTINPGPSNALSLNNVYGGYKVTGTTGDIFSGNTLNKNSEFVSINGIYNFEFINFGYSGNANIVKIDTTPTGANPDDLVKINTGDHSVTLDGKITGEGGINKLGDGTLTITADNDYEGKTEVTEGTLVITGIIQSTEDLTVHPDAVLELAGQVDGNVNVDADGTLNAHLGAHIVGNLNADNANIGLIIPPHATPGDIILKVDGDASVDGTDISIHTNGSNKLQVGEEVILIDVKSDLSGAPNHTAGGSKGSTQKQTYELQVDGKQIKAILLETSVGEEAKSLSEGYLAGAAVLRQAGDFAAGQALSAARGASKAYPLRPQLFAAIGRSELRYETGSHIEVSGQTFAIGLAASAQTAVGNATLAAFVEHGTGDSDTYNRFASGVVRGTGKTDYTGVGLVGRLDWDSGIYIETSARSGKVSTDYTSKDLKDAAGTRASYDTTSQYLGAHFGLGKIWGLSEYDHLTTYVQALWTRQAGDKTQLSTGEELKFDEIDATRAKIGTRFSRALSPHLTSYAGLAVEHEFGGTAKATTNGQKIDAPELKGSTGIVEVGLSGKPLANSEALSVDVGLQHYSGQQRGIAGSARINFAF